MHSETTYLWTTLLSGVLAISFILANCLQVLLILLACGELWGLIDHSDQDIVYTVHYLLFWLPLGASVLLAISLGILRLIKQKRWYLNNCSPWVRCGLLSVVWITTACITGFHPWMPLGGAASSMYRNNTRVKEESIADNNSTIHSCSTWKDLIATLEEAGEFGAVMFSMSVFGLAQICLVFCLFCIVQSIKMLCQERVTERQPPPVFVRIHHAPLASIPEVTVTSSEPGQCSENRVIKRPEPSSTSSNSESFPSELFVVNDTVNDVSSTATVKDNVQTNDAMDCLTTTV